MGNNSRFDYTYNAQISVDADLQIKVGLHISESANYKNVVKADFTYQEADNTFTCPESQVLKCYAKTKIANGSLW